jgi:RecJ-like exonuclease
VYNSFVKDKDMEYATVYEFFDADEILLLCFILPAISSGEDIESIVSNFTTKLTFYTYVFLTELDPEVECEACDGRGTQDCRECSGNGQVDCNECGGRGQVDCGYCDGTGEDEENDTCSYCDGDGDVECDECDGDGYERCSECNGSGNEDCDECNGTGYIETLDKFRGIQFDTITIDDSMISELPYYDFGDVMSEKLADKKNSIVIRQKELICDNDELSSKSDLEAETYYFIGMYDDNPQFRKGVNHILCSNEDTPIIC